MILYRPKIDPHADEWGVWTFLFWRRLGDHVVILQWVRCKTEDIDSSTYRTTWRRPDGVILHTERVDDAIW